MVGGIVPQEVASDGRAKGWKTLKNSVEFLQELFGEYTARAAILAKYEELGLGEGSKQTAAAQDPPKGQGSSREREKSQKTQGSKGGGKSGKGAGKAPSTTEGKKTEVFCLRPGRSQENTVRVCPEWTP